MILEPPAASEVTLRLQLFGARTHVLLRQHLELPAGDTLTDVELEIDEEIVERAAEIVDRLREQRRRDP